MKKLSIIIALIFACTNVFSQETYRSDNGHELVYTVEKRGDTITQINGITLDGNVISEESSKNAMDCVLHARYKCCAHWYCYCCMNPVCEISWFISCLTGDMTKTSNYIDKGINDMYATISTATFYNFKLHSLTHHSKIILLKE